MGKYEEALERARAGKPLDEVFPELKESDDERIRKFLVKYFEFYQSHPNLTLDVNIWQGEKVSNILAYLEKQKDLKYSEEYMEDVRQYAYNKGIVDAEEKHKEQKPAEWSEEEKGILLECISVLQNSSHWLLADKLSSLRPKPKREWSEEDEERLDSIIESYKELLKDYKACYDVDYIPYNSNTVIRNVVDDVNFLKSLRPQPHWKPSEEQMEALSDAYVEASTFKMGDILESLYNDLKKL